MYVDKHIDRHLLSDTIVAEIEQMIADKTLSAGDKLPPEEKLAKMFGVSRNILREALKTLRERGFVKIRVGDGVYVTQLEEDFFKDTMRRLITFGEIDISDTYETRMFLEIGGCAAAAERITDKEIEHLERLLTEMHTNIDNIDKWADLELDFHMTIARAVRNPLYLSLMDPITSHLVEIFKAGFSTARAEGLRGHKKIIEALRKHDRTLAENSMKEHLLRSKQLVVDAK
jgi:GntR family transcriptional repressor for pyruvate dehydrogenase complex